MGLSSLLSYTVPLRSWWLLVLFWLRAVGLNRKGDTAVLLKLVVPAVAGEMVKGLIEFGV